MEDALVYCKHAGKKDLDADDVQLAIQSRLDHSYTNPPPREVSKLFLQSYCDTQITINTFNISIRMLLLFKEKAIRCKKTQGFNGAEKNMEF